MDDRQNTVDSVCRMQQKLQQSGMDAHEQQKALLQFAQENMDDTQRQKLGHLLRDRDALQTLLRSDAAQDLLRRLQKR